MAESFLETLIELDENAILAQLNSIAQELGLINQIFNTSRIYLYYAVFARVWGNITSIIAQYLTNFDLENTTDEALLEMQIKPFVKKHDAKIAKTILQFKRRKNYNSKFKILACCRCSEGTFLIVMRSVPLAHHTHYFHPPGAKANGLRLLLWVVFALTRLWY